MFNQQCGCVRCTTYLPRDGSKINYSRQLELGVADSWVCLEKKAAVRRSGGFRISQAEEPTQEGKGGVLTYYLA